VFLCTNFIDLTDSAAIEVDYAFALSKMLSGTIRTGSSIIVRLPASSTRATDLNGRTGRLGQFSVDEKSRVATWAVRMIDTGEEIALATQDFKPHFSTRRRVPEAAFDMDEFVQPAMGKGAAAVRPSSSRFVTDYVYQSAREIANGYRAADHLHRKCNNPYCCHVSQYVFTVRVFCTCVGNCCHVP